MYSTSTSERQLIVADDAEMATIDTTPVEKGPIDEEQVEKLEAFSNEIPDGGLFAWLQVAGAFCIFFNTWFVNNA